MTKLKTNHEYLKQHYNKAIIDSLDDVLTNKPQKWVLSKYSAAALWGFSNLISCEIQVTFPKDQKSSKITDRVGQFIVYTRTKEKYSEGIIIIDYRGFQVKAYEPERTIIEIMKDCENAIDDIVIDTIKSFVDNVDYDKAKIEKYAKLFNIENTIKYVFGVLSGK